MTPPNESELRERIIGALAPVEPKAVRVLNAGALEEALWTEDEWQDEYATALARELSLMVEDGTLAHVTVLGMDAYHLTSKDKAA